MTVNSVNADAITVDFSSSHLGNDVPTGQTAGFHNFTLTLENNEDRPSISFTKQSGELWSTNDKSKFNSIGLENIPEVFNSSISNVSKNPNLKKLYLILLVFNIDIHYMILDIGLMFLQLEYHTMGF